MGNCLGFVNLEHSTTKIDKPEFYKLVRFIPGDLKEDAMTLYERLILEGMEKGLKQGETKTLNEVIKTAYLEGLAEEMIAKIAKMSLSELKARIKELGLKRN